jgi:hypothetical protein
LPERRRARVFLSQIAAVALDGRGVTPLEAGEP